MKMRGIFSTLIAAAVIFMTMIIGMSAMKAEAAEAKYGNDFKVVAYYPNWYGDFTSSVQWDKLTHVNYSFALPNRNGTIDSVAGSEYVITRLIKAAHKNDVKVNLAVGGWSYSDGSLCATVFEAATDTDAKCRSLANSILALVDQYGFDGVDVDWEYPTASSANQFTSLMRYLREGLTERGKLLTSAVQATGGTYQTDEVLEMVDWINVMAYDGDSGSGHSPYNLLVNAFDYWNGTRGVPADKVVLGVPFYERPNWASYADVVAADSANAYKDSTVINGTTVYYNGLTTMAQKASFAAQNAGGIMIWEISQDSRDADFSLLNTIYKTATEVIENGASDVTAVDIPGTIPVDSYIRKTSGISFSTENGVTYAGNLLDSSFLEYQVKVTEYGEYDITLRLAAGDTRYNADNVLIKINEDIVATVPITASSSWNNFIEHVVKVNFATVGNYKLTLVSDGGACNIADITATKTMTDINPFDDVKETDWYYPYAKFVYGNKLMTGKGNSDDGMVIFDPENTITRAEFVQMLYSKERKPIVEYKAIFTDVPDEEWYTDAIMWAYKNDIVSGKGADYFDVSGKITRQEMALILYKYALMKQYDVTAATDADITIFVDDETVADWAVLGMKWAVKYGVITGKDEDGAKVLAPGGNAIRAEAATMIKAFMVAYEGIKE